MALPTQTTIHKNIQPDNIHGIVSWTFASGEPNASITPTSIDVNKVAKRTSDGKLFYLSSFSPSIVWKSIPSSDDSAFVQTSEKAVANGVATLDVNSKLIESQLPLGETSSTAYRGDRGKIAYDHSQITHDKVLVGLGNVDNTSDISKPISTTTQTALDLKQLKFVGICQTTPLLSSMLSFDSTTGVLTLDLSIYQTGGYTGFHYFTDGNGVITKHTITSNSISFPPFGVGYTDTTGQKYFYFDNTGTPIASDSPWTNFDIISAVLRITWNSTLTGDAKIISYLVEYHTNSISSADHTWKHAQGAIWLRGFDSVHNAIATGIPDVTGLNTCFALKSGTNMDDNLPYTITNSDTTTNWNQNLGVSGRDPFPAMSIANGGQFQIRYKGVGGLPEVVNVTSFPFLWNVSNNQPEYVNSSGVRTIVPDDNFFVYFVYSIQDPRNGRSIRLTPNQTVFTTLTSAQAITWANIQSQDLFANDNEIRVLYRLIFQTNWSGGGIYPVECKYTALREVTDLRKVVISQATASGGTLPASSITNVPSGGVSSTNVQSAIAELDLEKLSISGTTLLPSYANNAAAISGGLIAGNLYRTGGDPDLICQVH